MNTQSFHSSYEENANKNLDEELIDLWLLFKEMEKNLTSFFRRIVDINDYKITFNIKEYELILHCSREDFKHGVCQVYLEDVEFILPEEKVAFLSRLSRKVPIPSK